MKTIGLLGGMSWESTALYYSAINKGINESLGGHHSAEIVMYSVDFAPIEQRQHSGDFDGNAAILSEASKAIEAAGADFMLICTNTMHEAIPEINKHITIPILHIADATAEVIKEKGIKTVGLLGTGFTMERDFYKGRLKDKHGINVITPNEADRKIVHDIIYNELVHGRIEPSSKAEYLRIINQLASEGAEAVILGCTEIGMLVKQAETEVQLLDTTAIHAHKAVERAVG